MVYTFYTKVYEYTRELRVLRVISEIFPFIIRFSLPFLSKGEEKHIKNKNKQTLGSYILGNKVVKKRKSYNTILQGYPNTI